MMYIVNPEQQLKNIKQRGIHLPIKRRDRMEYSKEKSMFFQKKELKEKRQTTNRKMVDLNSTISKLHEI